MRLRHLLKGSPVSRRSNPPINGPSPWSREFAENERRLSRAASDYLSGRIDLAAYEQAERDYGPDMRAIIEAITDMRTSSRPAAPREAASDKQDLAPA